MPAPTFAADVIPLRKVTVIGEATMKVAPDEMLWSVQVSINDASLAQAKARHDALADESAEISQVDSAAR